MRNFHTFGYALSILSACSGVAGNCADDAPGIIYEVDDDIPIEDLGEYADIYLAFEEQIELEESELDDLETAEFFVKKWSRKVKRWFKKQVKKILKYFLDLKDLDSPDLCAYTFVYYKRKIDKYHKTDLEHVLRKFDKNLPKDVPNDFSEHFKDRVRYFWDNPQEKVKHPDHNRYDFCVPAKQDELDYPPRAIFGGLEIACGSLICVLPWPGTEWLGRTLICHGMTQIYEGYVSEYEKNKRQERQSMESAR